MPYYLRERKTIKKEQGLKYKFLCRTCFDDLAAICRQNGLCRHDKISKRLNGNIQLTCPHAARKGCNYAGNFVANQKAIYVIGGRQHNHPIKRQWPQTQNNGENGNAKELTLAQLRMLSKPPTDQQIVNENCQGYLDVEFVEEVNRDDIFGPGVPMKKEGPEGMREWQMLTQRYDDNNGAMGANGIGWHGNWHWSQSSALQSVKKEEPPEEEGQHPTTSSKIADPQKNGNIPAGFNWEWPQVQPAKFVGPNRMLLRERKGPKLGWKK